MGRNNIYQTFKTNASMRASIGIATNPPVPNVFYYCSETNKQGYWYWAEGASEADNEGTVIVTTTGSHRLKRVFFFGNSHVFKNWFTGSVAHFTSVADANATLTSAYRLTGMRVFILETVIEEYWWRDGTADGDLVPVAGEIGIDNGPTTDGATEMLSAPDPFTIHCNSLLVEDDGSGVVDVTKSLVGGLLRFTVGAPGATATLTGTYEAMPAPTSVNLSYYATNQLFGRYLSNGNIWAYVPDTNTLVFESWLKNTSQEPYAGSVTNGGANFIDADNIGRWRLQTNTASNGTASVRLSQSMLSSFSGVSRLVMYVERVQVTALSNGTDRYIARIGRDVGSDQNGFWFEYSDNINSGKWLCVNCNSGTRTTSDSGITVSASAQYTMCMVLDFSGTDKVLFYINGVEVGTAGGHITNIPANLTSSYWGSMSIEKTLGTTSRAMMIGRTIINCEFTTGI